MARLDRSVPGSRQTEPRALNAALFKRYKELPQGRKVCGDTFKGVQTTTRANSQLVDPHPNAPLLKRMVLYPYVQECAPPVKGQAGDRTIPWDMLSRKSTPNAFLLYKAAKIPVVQGFAWHEIELGPKRRAPRAALSAQVADDARFDFGGGE